MPWESLTKFKQQSERIIVFFLVSLVKSQLDDIAADMVNLNTKYDLHGHGGMGAGPPTNAPLSQGYTSASDVKSDKVLSD